MCDAARPLVAPLGSLALLLHVHVTDEPGERGLGLEKGQTKDDTIRPLPHATVRWRDRWNGDCELMKERSTSRLQCLAGSQGERREVAFVPNDSNDIEYDVVVKRGHGGEARRT
jgi:hypothetical protein